MSVAAVAAADSGLMQAQARVITRCILNLILDEIARLTEHNGGDFVRAAVELSIMQATRPADGMTADAARAISVRAIATSLGIPYESCRRKVRELEAAGRCRRVGPTRVAIVTEAIAGPAYNAQCAERWNNLRGYLVELTAIGFDFGPFSQVSPQIAVRAPTRVQGIAALIDNFILRLIEARVSTDDSITDSAIITAMMSMNAQPMRHDHDLAWKYAGSETPPPDSARAPVTIAMLARRLRMSEDSIGRRVNLYVKRGWVRRVRGGYLFSMEQQQTPEVHQSRHMTVQRFLQLVQALRSLGIDPARPDAA
ncbi:MAG: helix-turn-helix domain-containing protein [Caulobacter sp.]|nr:helix-turn-helix domain-containing protein [Caulobacter sp.]